MMSIAITIRNLVFTGRHPSLANHHIILIINQSFWLSPINLSKPAKLWQARPTTKIVPLGLHTHPMIYNKLCHLFLNNFGPKMIPLKRCLLYISLLIFFSVSSVMIFRRWKCQSSKSLQLPTTETEFSNFAPSKKSHYQT